MRKNLIINQDYIEEYVSLASSVTNLSREQIIENILVHELHHIYGQTSSQRSGIEKNIEYNNDISLVKFYVELAKKDIDNSDTYLAKAELFTVRYDDKYRKNMDGIIEEARASISEFYNTAKEYYRDAA